MNTRTEEFSINDVSRHDAPKHDATRHSLTIKQASSLLTQLGVPRAPRSVQRFCEMGLIDCVATTGEKGTPRYFVNQQSLESYADELKQLQNISNVGNDMARNDAPERAIARHDAPTITPPGFVEIKKEPDPVVIVLQERVSVLEREKFQLQIDSTARAEVINQMRDQMRERERTWLKQITEQSREIGQLETQVRQLAAPKEDAERRHCELF